MKILLPISALCCAGLAISAIQVPANAQTNPAVAAPSASRFQDSILAAMNEPRLADSANNPSARTYRITIYPSLGIGTIAVRVEKQGDIYSLHARMLERRAGPEPGKLVYTRDTHLDGNDSLKLDGLVSDLNLSQTAPNDAVIGADGELWVLETVLQGQYRAIERWSPPDHAAQRGLKPLVAFCNFLIAKAKLPVAPQ